LLRTGPAKKVCIYVREDQRYHGNSTYAAILDFLFYRGISGATVSRGIAGFGSDHHLHTTRLVDLTQSLPVKIEFVESPEKVEEILPKLHEMAGTGLIEMQDTTVVKPASVHKPRAEPAPPLKLEGKAKLMRVYVGESDRWGDKPLYQAIVEALRANDVAGVTVYAGILGYGANRRMHHQKTLSLSPDRPIMLAVVDTEEKLRSITPILDRMVQQGLLVMSNVDIIKYTHDYREDERRQEARSFFVLAPLLASGMCFVDTPGLGSVFAANTAATHDFIPHIDAAIVVIGADPPISGEELAIVEIVAKQVSDLLFVLNKADRVTERERSAASAFARKLLESRLHHPVATIYEISALERLEKRGPERDWLRLITDLENLAENSGRSLAAAARDRGLRRVTDQLLRIVREEREALLRPVEESERRVGAMRTTIADAERQMMDLGYLFIAEQHRLSRTFADRRKEFLEGVRAKGHDELDDLLRTIHTHKGPRLRRRFMRAVQDIARKYVMPWLGEEEAFAEQAYRVVAQRFVEMGNDFLRRLADAGVPELGDVPKPLDADQSFRTRSEFYFKDFITIAEPASPLLLLSDLVLGIAGFRGGFERDAHELLDRMLDSNTSRVQSDVDRRVGDGKSRLDADIRILLHEVTAVAERALKHARAAQQSGTAAVEGALARLAAAEAEIRQLRPADADIALPTV
jgi:PII-like signaling protein